MKRLFNGDRIKIEQRKGEEPVCPRCGRYNAMLHTLHLEDQSLRECRDCHQLIFYSDGGGAIIIQRSLGKSCSKCGSFEMKEEKPGSRMFKCQDCSAPAVKY